MTSSINQQSRNMWGSLHSSAELGIGLTLVERLVELHGGAVEAKSAGAGAGSEFIVRLPVARAEAEEEEAEAEDARHTTEPPPHPDEPRPGAGARRILVVDDSVDSAESIALFLSLSGHDVRIANDGRTALEMAREKAPEIVLLDIGLPGMSGYEVARRLRTEVGLAQALIVAITGWGQESDRAEARAAGFDRHLVKPVNPDEVLALVEGTGALPSGEGSTRYS